MVMLAYNDVTVHPAKENMVCISSELDYDKLVWFTLDLSGLH